MGVFSWLSFVSVPPPAPLGVYLNVQNRVRVHYELGFITGTFLQCQSVTAHVLNVVNSNASISSKAQKPF